MSGHTALADRVGQHLLQQTPPEGSVDDLSDLWQLKAMVLAGVRLAPVYGKFNLGSDLPIRYQGVPLARRRRSVAGPDLGGGVP